MRILAVDPGKSGGIAVLGGAADPRTWKMPETEGDLLDLIRTLSADGYLHAVTEKVGATPQMGTVSAFTFGYGYGALRMALLACGVSLEPVAPGVWKKALGVPRNESSRVGSKTTETKNASKRRAQELFPALKITHAIADALLLAEWGRRHHSQEPAPAVPAQGSLLP